MSEPVRMSCVGLDLEDGDRVVGFWWAGNGRQDWMAVIAAKRGRLHCAHRFRYYRDRQAFASKDERRFYGGELGEDTPDARAQALAAFQMCAATGAARFGFEVFHFAGGTLDELARWLVRQPFAHVCAES